MLGGLMELHWVHSFQRWCEQSQLNLPTLMQAVWVTLLLFTSQQYDPVGDRTLSFERVRSTVPLSPLVTRKLSFCEAELPSGKYHSPKWFVWQQSRLSLKQINGSECKFISESPSTLILVIEIILILVNSFPLREM